MLTKEQKLQMSEQLRAELSGIDTLFLLENIGLKVNEVNELRSQVRGSDGVYKVFRNSVVRLAVAGTDKEMLTPHLTGPKALAFTSGDGVALARVLRDFIKHHPALSFQQAYLEGQVVGPLDAQKIADIPSKPELIARLLSLLQSPIRRLAVALNAPTQGLASVLDQIAKQREPEGGSQ